MPAEINFASRETVASSGEPKLTGRHVFMMLLGFFGLMVVANVILIYYALNSWTGLEVESSYTASQTFQAEIDQAGEQRVLGWQVETDVARDADGRVVVAVVVADKSGTRLDAVTVEGALTRPTQTAMDRPLTFHEGERGQFIALGEAVSAGAWTLRLTVSDDDGNLFKTRNRVMLAAPGS